MHKKTHILLSWFLIFALSISAFSNGLSITAMASETNTSGTETTETDSTEEETTVDLGIEINKTNFPGLYKTLKLSFYDWDLNGYLSDEEIEKMTTLFVEDSISDITGLQYLTNLNALLLKEFTGKTLKIPKANSALTELYVKPTAKSFTVNAPQIKSLYLIPLANYYVNQGGEVWIAGTQYINSSGGIKTPTTSVNVSKCSNLESFWLTIRTVKTITWPETNTIKAVNIGYWDGTNPSLGKLTKLEYLSLDACDNLKKLDTSGNTKLTYLYVEACPKLTTVNFKKNKNLKYVYFGDAAIKKYDFSSCKKIEAVFLNDFFDAGKRTLIMPSGKKSNGYIRSEDVQKFREAIGTYNNGYTTDGIKWEWPYPQKYRLYSYASLKSDDEYEKIVKVNKTNFPELYKAVKEYDRNENGWLEGGEIRNLSWLSVDYKISNLKGITYLTGLKTLILKQYTGTSIKVTSAKNEKLISLTVTTTGKKLTVNAPNVHSLTISPTDGNKKLKTVNTSACTKVKFFSCYGSTALTSLKLPNSGKQLKTLYIGDASLTSLDLSSYKNLEHLELRSMSKLKSLPLKKNTKLRLFYITYSKVLKKVDLSKCTKLEEICGGKNQNLTIKKPSGISFPDRETIHWAIYVQYSIK